MKLRLLKNLILIVSVFSVLTASAACKKLTKRRNVKCGSAAQTCRVKRAPATSCRKGGCGVKTTVVIRKKAKGCRSGACGRPAAPGRYRIRFERRSLTNGLERIDFQRPVRTRY